VSRDNTLVETIYWDLTKPKPRWATRRLTACRQPSYGHPRPDYRSQGVAGRVTRWRQTCHVSPSGVEMPDDRLRVSGTVECTPPKIEHTEEWEAIPLTARDGQARDR
jgi:hypothetical protein